MALPTPAEEFLLRVHRGLGALGPAERDDIVAELRAHLLDRQAEGNADLLTGFGAPESLAASYLTEHSLRGALARGTSWALGRALWIAARDSTVSLFGLLPLVVMQLAAVAAIVTAALKPFMPLELGLWVGGGSFYVGPRSANPAIHEVLGAWGVPVLACSGVILFWASNRAMRALVRWRLHGARRS